MGDWQLDKVSLECHHSAYVGSSGPLPPRMGKQNRLVGHNRCKATGHNQTIKGEKNDSARVNF